MGKLIDAFDQQDKEYREKHKKVIEKPLNILKNGKSEKKSEKNTKKTDFSKKAPRLRAKNSISKQEVQAPYPPFKNLSEKHISNVAKVLKYLKYIDTSSTLSTTFTLVTLDSIETKYKILLFSFLPTTISEIAKGIKTDNLAKVLNHIKGTKDRDGLLDLNLIELVNKEKKQYQITKEGQNIFRLMFEPLIERRKQEIQQQKEEIAEEEKISNFIEKFKEFIEKTIKSQENTKIVINFKELVRFNHQSAEYLLDDPLECYKIINLAIEDLFDNKKPFEIINLPNTELLKIGEKRKEHLNKLKRIRGTVSSLSDVNPNVILTKFECPTCGSVINIPQNEKKLKEPTRCGCGRKGKMTIMSEELVDLQKMIIEELPEELDGRSESRKLKVILKGHLTKYNIQPLFESSNKLELIGILKAQNIEKGGSKETDLDYIFEVNSINTKGWKDFKITQKEQKEIEEISKKEDLKKFLVSNVAPHLAGLEFEKFGLIISIVSGGDPSKCSKGKRDDAHLLFVGDPSVGKSQLMQFGQEIYPKARWVSGNSSTKVGLIGSVKHDEFINQTVVSKGALALANHHIVFIDELDKMDSLDKNALHSSMEDQFASIDKWDKHTKFQTDTTVIAAMNPMNSKFSDEQYAFEQIELAQTIIDRFDLIFIIKDEVNEKKDKDLVEKILSEHNEESKGTIDKDLFIKYLAYARTFKPKLSKESQDLVKEAYLQLRNQYERNMTSRQLHGIVRLSLAICKLRLSNKTTKEDTELAINLVRYCLVQQGILEQDNQPIFEDI